MKKWYLIAGALVGVLSAGAVVWVRMTAEERAEALRFERQETQLLVSNLPGARVRLYLAGKRLENAAEMAPWPAAGQWLPPGSYFLKVSQAEGEFYYPAPLTGYRRGPDRGGSLAITVRPAPPETPPRPPGGEADFVYIPSGHFLIGDRQNPREPHYVWLTGYFISAWEVSNAEFKAFRDDPAGYADGENWTAAGCAWRQENRCNATALLTPSDRDFRRFGLPDQPVVLVTWFEAGAYCRWLTRKIGGAKWVFALPTDAEWEKAARGPDNFEYGLSATVSDNEVALYNWKKNPDAPVSVVGRGPSLGVYGPNRYGLYHISGNVAEWTQSLFLPFSQRSPYREEQRNRDDASGQRTVRGGSWYSASIALLHLAYRDAFQPEHRGNDVGFRIVARPRP
jgi:formylglycine-generating enzyme required for sulfatase activity